jgi:hypothetical protein
MKYKIIFKTYITDFDIDPEEVGRGFVWLENNALKIRISNGDPYFVYSCIKDTSIEEMIVKRLKSSRRIAYAHNDTISLYISRTPELFVREPLDTALLPPKYRISSSPRIVASDETGLEQSRSRRFIVDEAIFELDDFFGILEE